MDSRVQDRTTLILALIPIIVLVAIACLQLYLAHTQNLSPWRLGGFGMFSTVGDINLRYLRAYALTPGGEKPVGLESIQERRVYRFRVLPTPAGFANLAEHIACDPELRRLEPDMRAVRLEYWTADFDSARPALEVRPVWKQTLECRR